MFSNNVPNRTHVQTVPGSVVVGLFPIYSVYNSEISVTFLMTMTKYLTNRNWRKGGFILAHSLKGVHFPSGKWKRYTEDLQVFDIKFCCLGSGANIQTPSCGWGGSLLPGPKQTNFGKKLKFKVEMTLPAAWCKVYCCDQHGVHLPLHRALSLGMTSDIMCHMLTG